MSEDIENSNISTLTISEQDREEFKRLDQFLAHKIDNLSRNFIKSLYERGKITSSTKIELKRMPPSGSSVTIQIPPPRQADAIAQDIPIDIIFEDEHLLLVNKAAGMVVHPAPGNYDGTLVNAILYHCPDLKGIGDQKRPGIVHRLDKGTSGIMVVAKTQQCHEGLVKLFSTHDIDREYEALAMGSKTPAGGKLESTIGRHPQNRLKMAINVRGGKDAITYYNVINYYDKMCHVKLKLETGRTHQIRVHLSQLLHRPILCDSTYGNPKEHLIRLGKSFKDLINDYEYPFLHARLLGFIHPITQEKISYEVEPPQMFKDVLKLANKENLHE